MNRLCNFHPETAAKWGCKHCNIAWCSVCIESNTIQAYGISGAQRAQYYCPSCNRPVKGITLAKGRQSSWMDVLAFFLQPLQTQPLGFIIPISIVTTILASMGLHPIFFLFLWGSLLPLAVRGLEETALGSTTLPKLSRQTLTENIPEALKHFSVFLPAFVICVQLGDAGGMSPAGMYLWFAMALIPAIVTVLFLTERIRSALNPRLIAMTVRQLGEGYVALAFLLPFFLITTLQVGTWIGDLFSLDLQRMYFSLAANYFTLVSYLLIGYMIHHRQKSLASVPDFSGYFSQEEEVTGELSHNQALQIVDQLLAEDRPDDALEYVESRTPETIFDLHLAQRYFDLLKVRHEKKKLLEHAKVYLDLLAGSNRDDELCTIYMDCQSEDPRFAPSPSTLFSIARLLNKKGNPRAAVAAFYQFGTVYQRSAYAPKALFLAATILNDRLKEPEKAVSVLKDVVNRYPDHHNAREAREYLKELMRRLRQKKARHLAPVYELRAVK